MGECGEEVGLAFLLHFPQRAAAVGGQRVESAGFGQHAQFITRQRAAQQEILHAAPGDRLPCREQQAAGGGAETPELAEAKTDGRVIIHSAFEI